MEDRKEVTPEVSESRRSAVKKMAYVAPIVLSLAASPTFASSGSGNPRPESAPTPTPAQRMP